MIMNRRLLTFCAVGMIAYGTLYQGVAQNQAQGSDHITKQEQPSAEAEAMAKGEASDASHESRRLRRFRKNIPSFPGGHKAMMQFIAQNIVYPESAVRENRQGKVSVHCAIGADGSISGVKVARSSGHKDLDAEAVRIVNLMPKFVYPEGANKVRPDVVYHIPVLFRLSQDKDLDKMVRQIDRRVKEVEPAIEAATKRAEQAIARAEKSEQVIERSMRQIEPTLDRVQRGISRHQRALTRSQHKMYRIGTRMAFAQDSCEENVFEIVSEEPQFPGGGDELRKFLAKNVDYPKKAVEIGLQGRTQILFIVEKDGSVSEVKVEKSSGHKLLDEEALRVGKLVPGFIPGKVKGEAVRSRFILTISFRMGHTDKAKK